MKFIGQYIQDLIARFRSDVYLEDVSTGTIASGGNLGLDSNNKIVKANEPTSHDAVTLAGTPDYITISGQEITRNAIALADDVSGFLPVANGGTAANNVAGARASLGVDVAGTDNSTNVTLAGTPDYITISGQEITRNQIDLTEDVTGVLPVGNTAAKVTSVIAGDGIDVDSTTGDVTVTAETASATNPGVVELATTAETTTGTDTTRAVTPDGLKDGYQGSTNVTTLGSITTGVWRGSAIDQAYLSGQSGTNTGDESDADATTKGIVELATTAEADTGTDTARAITAAGLKSHVDKRYSYQYLTWEVNTASFTSTNYEWPASNGGFGSEEFTTNTSVARNTSIVDGHTDTPTYSAAKNLQHMGWYVPHACQLVGVSGAFRNNGGLTTPRDVAVFVGTPDIGSTATPTYTQRAFAAGDVDGGQANSRTYTTNVTRATPFDLVAGNVVMPAVCDAAGNSSVFMQGNFSIIIRTLII